MGPVSRTGKSSVAFRSGTGTGVDAEASSGCAGGITECDSRSELTILAIVLVTAEKAGGDSVHPMGNGVGIATKDCPWWSNGTASLRVLVGLRCSW